MCSLLSPCGFYGTVWEICVHRRANTCIAAFCLLFSVKWPDMSFRIMQIPETLHAYRGESDPSAKWEVKGEERGNRPREFWKVFKYMVLHSCLCEWLSKMAARTHFMWESAEQISECTEGGRGRRIRTAFESGGLENVTVLKRAWLHIAHGCI